MPDQDPDAFDAVAAAKELDEFLAESAAPATRDDEYIAVLESQLEDAKAVLAKKDAELAKANTRADQAHAEIEAAERRLANASAKELERRTRSLLESFLSVIDDLDRAIAVARQHVESADVVEGLE